MNFITVLKITLGFIALILGSIGIFLPVLPTTPFFLLSVSLFASHPKLQKMLLKIRYINLYYQSYVNGQGLPRGTIIFSLSFLWAALLISIMLTWSAPLTILLIFVGITVSIHVLDVSRPREKRFFARIKKRKGEYNEKI